MHRLALLLLLFLFGFGDAMADSVIVIAYSKNGLAAAAESRAGGTEVVSDRACKILPLGNEMFFAAAAHSLPAPDGSGADTKGDAWIYSEAKVSFRQWQVQGSKNDILTSVEAVAENWKNSIQEVLEETFATQPGSFVQMPRDGYLLRGVFGGLNANGEISLAVVSVKPKKAPNFEVLLEHLTPGSKLDYLTLGRTEVAREFLEMQTERAQMEAAQQESELAGMDVDTQLARRAARLVDLTIGMQPPEQSTVGGPIDILQLRPNGQIKWLQRKENCASAK